MTNRACGLKHFTFLAALLFGVQFVHRAAQADKYKDSFAEAAYSGNIMLVKTHINDLRGQSKERLNEALRAAASNPEVSAATSIAEPAPAPTKTSKISARFKNSTTDVVKMLLAAGANPNDQSFGRPTIYSLVTNADIKNLLQTAGGKESISDQLAAAVKNKNAEDFQKMLEQSQPGDLKLGNGIHIPTLIFENINLKSTGPLLSFSQNPDPLIKMYMSFINSKKGSDVFMVYEKNLESEFGRREKTQPLIALLAPDDRWDLIEILAEHNVEIPQPYSQQIGAKWFDFRTKLFKYATQNVELDKDEAFKKLYDFMDSAKLQKFDKMAKKLPFTETEKLDQFFLDASLPEAEKLKFFESMNWKVSAQVAATYLMSKEQALAEQEFRMLERSTNKKEKPVTPEMTKPIFESGNIKMAQQLLRLGAPTDGGLCIAVKKNNFQLVQLLLSYKALTDVSCDKDRSLEKIAMTPQMQRLLFGQKSPP